jgi:hypothetical protein
VYIVYTVCVCVCGVSLWSVELFYHIISYHTDELVLA